MIFYHRLEHLALSLTSPEVDTSDLVVRLFSTSGVGVAVQPFYLIFIGEDMDPSLP